MNQPAKPEPTFTVKVYAAAPYLKPGYFEGGADHGQVGNIYKRDITVGTATIGIIAIPFTGGLSWSVGGGINAVNLAVNSSQVMTNNAGMSGLQQVVSPEYADDVGKTELLLSIGAGFYSGYSVFIKNQVQSVGVNAISTINSGVSIKNTVE